MKTVLILLTAMGTTAAAVEPVTHETAAELAATLDANADGRTDLLVVDKTSGLCRLAVQKADGTLDWPAPFSCGLDGVAALSAGPFATGEGQGFVVAAPDWNRVLVFPTTDAVPVVAAASATGIGPEWVVAVNVTGAGDDPALDDVVTAAGNNGAPDIFQLGAGRWDGFGVTGFQSPTPASLRRGNRVRLVTSGVWMAGAIRAAGTGSEFVALACSVSGCTEAAIAAVLPANADYAWHDFAGNGRSQFVFYAPGETSLRLRPVNAAAVFGAGSVFALGQPIARVTAVPKSSGALLLVVFGDGSTAAVYDFNGASAPALRQNLAAPAGSRFSSASPLGNGDFLLLNGPQGPGGPSSRWQRWKWNGVSHAVSASGDLPALPSAAGRANVFLYATDPSAEPDIGPLLTLSVADWTTESRAIGADFEVTAERLRSAAQGLGSPSVTPFTGPFLLHPGIPFSPEAAFARLNQTGPDSSVFCPVPGLGEPAPDVRFVPPPGSYHLADGQRLTVSLDAGRSEAPVYFRTSPAAAWRLADPATPIPLAATTTVEAWAGNDRRSSIRRGTYVIAAPPPILPAVAADADHDGLSDGWEQAFGLADPAADADSDGFANRAEQDARTDPLDPRSNPALTTPVPTPVLTATDGFNILSWDPTPRPVVLEASGNLDDWEPVSPPPQFNLWAEPAASRRFYRLTEP